MIKSAERLLQIPVEKIIPNKDQPRKQFDPEELRSLALSIRENGIIQPLSVRKNGSDYMLIAGERRLRAAKMAGYDAVPCVIMRVGDEQSAQMALVENLQREGLNPFEEAEAIERLMQQNGLTQEQTAKRLGKTQSALSNKLRLLRISPFHRRLIADAGLTERHARAILKIEDENKRTVVLNKVIDKGFNVLQTEDLVRRTLTAVVPRSKGSTKRVVKDVRIFVNTIDGAIKVMQNAGIQAQADKTETEGYIEYVVRITKNGIDRRELVNI